MFPDRSFRVRNRLTLTDDWVCAQKPTISASSALTTSRAMSAGRRRALSSVSRIQLTRGARSRGDGIVVGVLGVIPVEQLDLAVALREHEEHDRRAEDDRDQSGEVGPIGAVEERRLRGGDDLLRVL